MSISLYGLKIISLLFVIKVGYMFENDETTDNKLNNLFEGLIEHANIRLANHSKCRRFFKKLIRISYR